MQLTDLRVQNYRSIEDSGWVSVSELTCLVGKNESGKSAFMDAVNKLNPAYGAADYEEYKEYPRSRWIDYENEREAGAPPDEVASARFRLAEDEREIIETEYGRGILADSREVELTKDYDNQLHWDVDIDVDNYLSYIVGQHDIEHHGAEESFHRAESPSELIDSIDTSTANQEFDELRDAVSRFDSEVISNELGRDILKDFLPTFRYMGDYSILDATINVDELIGKDRAQMSDEEGVFMDLLSVGNIELSSIRDEPNWELIKTRFEAAQSHITNYMLKYWSQNENIKFEFLRETADQAGPSKWDQGTLLQVRVENQNNEVTIDFDQRSRGFRWFFSSFCHFTEIKDSDEDLVLLLDEPGLHLHAKAQQDFLEFLNIELSNQHTVIYTTHSPFMLLPRELHQAKLVMQEGDAGTTISNDVLRTDEDTKLPLQSAFEFDLIDTLLIRPQTLLVEGKSDQIYIYLMSRVLEDKERLSLDERWTIINVGSGDNIPTFVSLFGGNELDLGILLDADSTYQGRIDRILDRGEVEEFQIKSIVSFLEDEDEGDIEDLFSTDFYFELVNGAFAAEIATHDDLTHPVSEADFAPDNRHPRIVKRFEKFFDRQDLNDNTFEHARPAKYFQDNRDGLTDSIDEDSLDNFEQMFESYNELLIRLPNSD